MLTLRSPGSRQFSWTQLLWTGWYPTAKAFTAVHSPQRLHFPTCGCVERVTIRVMR